MELLATAALATSIPLIAWGAPPLVRVTLGFDLAAHRGWLLLGCINSFAFYAVFVRAQRLAARLENARVLGAMAVISVGALGVVAAHPASVSGVLLTMLGFYALALLSLARPAAR
jgi:hypothetical protein